MDGKVVIFLISFFFCWTNESGLRFILSIVVYGVW